MADQAPTELPVRSSGATLPDQERARRVFTGRPGLAVRAGQSSERAQLIYQHSTVKHQRRLAQGIDTEVRERLREAGADRSEAN